MKKKKTKIPAKRLPGSPKAERCIFKFWEGSGDRTIDPLEVQYVLATIDGFDLDRDMKLASSQLAGDEATRALHRVIEAVRKAFGIKKLDAGGLTGGECMAVLIDFAGFIDGLKKKLGLSQTSLPSAVPPDDPSPMPSSADFSPTAPASSQPDPSSTPPGPQSFSEGSFPENGPTL